MNVLILFPAMPINFLSFPSLCHYKNKKSLSVPLAPITVAALLPRDWSIRFVDLNIRPLTEEDWNWSDLIMVTGMIIQKEQILDIVRESKKREKIVVAGGPLVTTSPDAIHAAGCDFIVRGEGENTVPQLIAALESGERGKVIESQDKPDLSLSPIPRFDLVQVSDYLCMSIQTSRGCPFDCEFCDVVNLYGKKPRYKSSEQILEELEILYTMGARDTVIIWDDNFIANPSRAKSFLNDLIPWMKKKGEPFQFMTQVSLNLSQDMELIDLMTEANFSQVFIGLESTEKIVLEAMNKNQNIQNPLLESIRNISRNGISIVGSFIIGFDGEKKGADKRICALIDKTQMPIADINLLQPIPGTRLWQRLKEEGRINEKEINYGNPQTGLNYIPDRAEAEIQEEYRNAWKHAYDQERYFRRVYRYHLEMRPTRAVLAKAKGEPLPKIQQAKVPFSETLLGVRVFLVMIWKYGLRGTHRRLFLKQLAGIWKMNRSRIVRYFICIILYNDFRRISENPDINVLLTHGNEEQNHG